MKGRRSNVGVVVDRGSTRGKTLNSSRSGGRARRSVEAAGPRLHRTIWYMGAKARVIPGFLDRVLSQEVRAGGTLVDLMSGTGVVAAHCANRYRVFSNDAQHYAHVIARSLIEHDPGSTEEFLASVDPERDLQASFQANFAELEALLSPTRDKERLLLKRFESGARGDCWCHDYRSFLEETTSEDTIGLSPTFIDDYRSGKRRRPACLATSYYGNVYFGLAQAMAIDSIRAAIDDLDSSDPMCERKRIHYLSALLHMASISTSGTSHFAQPRHLRKDSELRAMATRRIPDLWTVFSKCSSEIVSTVRQTSYTDGNRAFVGDYQALLNEQRTEFLFPSAPDLIYLDPPYTADNYSRFYHVLEVLVRYDYPRLATDRSGRVLRGRYPEIEERFQSGFCRAPSVEEEFRQVIRAAAATGAKLVISYSSPTGLLLKRYMRETPERDPVERLEELCQEAFSDVRTERRALMHSGQGDSNLSIEELLVVCRQPC